MFYGILHPAPFFGEPVVQATNAVAQKQSLRRHAGSVRKPAMCVGAAACPYLYLFIFLQCKLQRNSQTAASLHERCSPWSPAV